LALPDQRPLELSEPAHHREQESGHRAVVTGKRERLLGELKLHAPPGEFTDQTAEVIEVAGESIHRVHDHGVALAHVSDHGIEFGSGGALA
jgi:hypothetical protein